MERIEEISVNGQTIHQTTDYIINKVLIPVVQRWPNSKVVFRQWDKLELIHVTVFDNADYEYLIELQPISGLREAPPDITWKSRWFACRVKPVIPGYDFDMEYPSKNVDLKTLQEILEVVEYLMTHMRTPAKVFTDQIDLYEAENNL